MTRAVLAGVALGVLSRIDETTASPLPVSDNATWVLAALLAGALASARPVRAAVVVVTAANLAYYAWIAMTEPGVPLGSVAGSPLHWVALGMATGVVFGAAGAVMRGGPLAVRGVALALPLTAVALDRAGALERLMP